MKSTFSVRLLVAVAMIAAGAAIIAYPYLTDLRYAVAQNQLAAAAAATVPPSVKGGQAMPHGAVARLVIPKISLDAYVLDGTDTKTLDRGPGHYEETPLPGEQGNCAIAGHRTTYGHPFRELDQLRKGDLITTYTATRTATYRVTKVYAVDPTDVGVAEAKSDNRLTLTTCHPEGSARQRLIVVAKLVN
jgi:LPXTG-site transpeptidase (sortase) family protein